MRNQKILDLAKEAGYDENDAKLKKQLKDSGFNLELFAAMVVQKCADITKEPGCIGRSDLDWDIVFKYDLGLPQKIKKPKKVSP